MTTLTRKYLLISFDFKSCHVFESGVIPGFTERHKITITPSALFPFKGIGAAIIKHPDLEGVIFEQLRGCPTKTSLSAAGDALRIGKKAFFYWSKESAIEVLTSENIGSHWRLWFFVMSYKAARKIGRKAQSLAEKLPIYKKQEQAAAPAATIPGNIPISDCRNELASAHPVPFPAIGPAASGKRVKGTGMYMRFDYWAKINTGGSYGHTCYVAKELAKITDDFVAVMSNGMKMIDDLGIRQIAVDSESSSCAEENLANASIHYYKALKPLVQYVKPSYFYERYIIGSYVTAKLSREFKIPYILEYNGSEISLRKSFGDGHGFTHEDFFVLAEDVVFNQASLIVVVSEVLKDQLIARGVNGAKILVNPNGADADDYRPPTSSERDEVLKGLGWDSSNVVAGFSGTFGGWHGIDTLAEALPKIMAANPNLRFLLIGNGGFKRLVDAVIDEHNLHDRVFSAGLVEHSEGARLLKACDIFVSPHNAHMVDSKFFGSPTKIFEYMAVGRAIVASDLEQIGEILAPGVRIDELRKPEFKVENQVSVLCKPGDANEFAEAVTLLAGRADIREAIGKNAREALIQKYSWQKHVERIWDFAAGIGAEPKLSATEAGRRTLKTGNEYKDEVQNQWDNNPCGAHYITDTPVNTLEWYLNVEKYRYEKYAPWMLETMEFNRHAGKRLLEIGSGIGTDLAQFAKGGAIVTDLDLSSGHLALARENFKLRGLTGTFLHGDVENLPFESGTFDVIYSNGVIHHTPNTQQAINQIFRTLKPGGKAIIMVYAEYSYNYWHRLVYEYGLCRGLMDTSSIGEVMSANAESSETEAKPLVKVYTAKKLREMFCEFENIQISKCQYEAQDLPGFLNWMPLETAGKLMGWNLVVKAIKPASR